MPSQMRCDVFLTRIICVFLAFIYGSEIRLDETKGNDRAQLSSATQYTVQTSNERGRRKSTRDVFNAFYFEFSSCLFMLFAQSACVLVAFSMGTKESKTKRNETNEQSASKKKKKTHTSSTATATTYRARDKSNRNVENNTQCLRVLPLRSKNRVDESSFANETNTLSPSPSPS